LFGDCGVLFFASRVVKTPSSPFVTKKHMMMRGKKNNKKKKRKENIAMVSLAFDDRVHFVLCFFFLSPHESAQRDDMNFPFFSLRFCF
jgi:hypothetical protein